MNQLANDSYFLIINAKAGGRRERKHINEILARFNQLNCHYNFAYTEYEGHGKNLAIEAIENGFNVLVAMGGDGTVNEVASGMIGSNAVLAIIPTGSGNGLARDLKIPFNLKRAFKIAVSGTNKAIDIPSINNRVFLCTSGMGFDAHIAYRFSQAPRRGKWQYIKCIVHELFQYKPISLEMEIEGIVSVFHPFLITFANARQYGNNAFIAPNALIDDGLLNITIVKRLPKLLAPFFGLALKSGIIHRTGLTEHATASAIIIRNCSSKLFHIDGESIEFQLPAQITIRSKALKVRT